MTNVWGKFVSFIIIALFAFFVVIIFALLLIPSTKSKRAIFKKWINALFF